LWQQNGNIFKRIIATGFQVINRTIYGGNPADGSVIAFWFEYT